MLVAVSDVRAEPSPPVIEVALAIEFGRIQELGPVALARLASEWATEYPVMREVPGLPPTNLNPGVESFQIVSGSIPSRIWLLSSDGNDLLQVQQDRIIVNWRRLDSDLAYPGHQTLLNTIRLRWNELVERLSALKLPTPTPTLVEWTYVNHLDQEILTRRGLTFFNNTLDELPGEPNSFAFEITRKVSVDGQQGFMAVVGALSPSPSESQIFALTIMTKLQLDSQDPQRALDLLLHAHELSRAGFDKVTSSDARTGWGLDS